MNTRILGFVSSQLSKVSTILAVVIVLTGLATTAQAVVVTVIDNQFDGTWNTSDGNPIATYTPDNVGDTFSNNSDTNGATWTVATLTPQPWSLGGVIFTGGANTTGEITTEITTVAGGEYTFSWAVNLIGAATGTDLIATAYDGSGTGNPVLNSQVLGTGGNSSFTFIGDGGTVTLGIGVNSVGANASSDVYVDFVTVTANIVPEPNTLALGALGLAGLAVASRRRRTRTV